MIAARFRFPIVAAAALILAMSIDAATAQDEVLTQENEVGAADWVPAITMLYVATEGTGPVFEPGMPPEFPSWEAKKEPEKPPEGQEPADVKDTDDENPKSGPPVLKLIGGGPPVRDWKAYLRQIKSDRNVSFLGSTLREGKPAFWVHDITETGYLLAYDADNRLVISFKVDMLRDEFPSPDIPTGPDRRRFVYDNIKIVLGSLKVDLLNRVTEQGAEGEVIDTVYEFGMAGTTLAEIEDLGVNAAEFVPRLASKVKGGLINGVYRATLELQLEAWGALGFEEPSKRSVEAEIRFTVLDTGFAYDQIGGESEGGEKKPAPEGAAAGGAAGGAEAQ